MLAVSIASNSVKTQEHLCMPEMKRQRVGKGVWKQACAQWWLSEMKSRREIVQRLMRTMRVMEIVMKDLT